MNLFELLPTLDIHDLPLNSLTLGFEANYVVMEVDFYQEQTDLYITHRWTFKGVSNLSMTNWEVLSNDVEIYSLEIQEAAQNTKRITFQFLQGFGRASATLDFHCNEAFSEQDI